MSCSNLQTQLPNILGNVMDIFVLGEKFRNFLQEVEKKMYMHNDK